MDLELHDLDSFELFVDVEKILDECVVPLGGRPTPRTNKNSRDSKIGKALEVNRPRHSISRRAARQRQKEAREALRRQERELSSQLELLRSQQLERPNYGMNCSSGLVLWKAIAKRQREMRLHAEAEHRQLSLLVKRQAACIHELMDDAQKRLTQTGSVDATEVKLSLVYLQELDDMYKRFDEVYEQTDVSSLLGNETMAYTVRRKSDDAVEYFEEVTKALHSSSLRECEQFFRRISDLAYSSRMKGDQRYPMGERSPLVVQFREETTLATGAKVSMLQRSFARRCEGENRMVHLWKFVSEGEGVFDGLQSEETGWCCFRPHANSLGTIVEMYQRWIPTHFSSVQSHTADEEFHKVLRQLSDTTMAEVMASLKTMELHHKI